MKRLILVIGLLVSACETGDYLPIPQGVDGGPPDRGVSTCSVVDGGDGGSASLSCPDGGAGNAG